MEKIVFIFFLYWIAAGSAQTALQGVEKTLDVAAGYSTEDHFVDSDGYILKLFRIKANLESSAAENKTVVFLMHGLLCSANDWIVIGANKSLAYLLVDAGYDVWLGNARGTTYSRAHKSLSPKQKEFWQFSWTEIGIFDLPEMIDFILGITNQTKLHYVGHSQGTTSFFVMASELPQYNDKIATMHALAPVVYMNHAFSPFMRLLAPISPVLSFVFKLIDYNEFFSANDPMIRGLRVVCNAGKLGGEVCLTIFFLVFGFDYQQIDSALVPKIFENFPAGMATNQLIHYLQIVKSGNFEKFDYYLRNEAKYNASSPPDFDLSKITAPVYLHWGENDWVSSGVDLKKLEEELGNHKLTITMPRKMFNHLDFLYGTDADSMLYKPLIEIIRNN